MSENRNGRMVFVLVLVVILVLQIWETAAMAEESEEPNVTPGTWIYTDIVDDEETDLAMLLLEKDGTMTLYRNGENECIYAGRWSSELITDEASEYSHNDKLTLHFTLTDDPEYVGKEYDVECIHYVYAEGWIENDCRLTYMITTASESDGICPLKALCSDENDEPVLHKTERPNMQIVNCKNYVSLRESRSTKSARLAKVPLGAVVFAFPEDSGENGFTWCVYQDEYGYILSEYLKPVEE